MCGRTACTLAPDDVCKACSYRDAGKGTYVVPEWKDAPGGQTYVPSTNIAPTNFTPILLHKSALDSVEGTAERLVQPMMWGMIPVWHKGEPTKHGLSTNNCRVEGLSTSRLYSVPFKKGKRCVILCDGFYEWQTTKGKTNKQPYFIYAQQPGEICINDKSTWDSKKCWNEKSGWKGPQLLKMAGIFDLWKSSEGEEIYSYTVITMDAHKTLSWLHTRMPAILDSEEDVKVWLDTKTYSPNEALAVIKPNNKLIWHPVSTVVNNVRNKDADLNKPIDLGNTKGESASGKLMSKWLTKGTLKKEPKTNDIKTEVCSEDESVAKKIKTDIKEEVTEDETVAKKIKTDIKNEECI